MFKKDEGGRRRKEERKGKGIHQNTNYGCLDIWTIRNVFSTLCSIFPTILFNIHILYYDRQIVFSKIKHSRSSCLTMKWLRESCMAELHLLGNCIFEKQTNPSNTNFLLYFIKFPFL